LQPNQKTEPSKAGRHLQQLILEWLGIAAMKLVNPTSSLRNSLVIPGAAIMLVLSFGLICVGYWSGNAIVNTMSEQLIRHMTTSIRDHVNIMMDVPSRMLTRVRNTVARHHIALTDPHALAAELYALLRDEPDVDWLYFANEAGGIVSTGRLADGKRVISMTDKFQAGVIREYNVSPDGRMTTVRKSGAYFDPHRRDWYKTAKETRKSIWTKAYIGSIEPILGISISALVIGQGGECVGVYGLDLILTRLSDFMRRQRLGNNGRAFLVDDDDYLIASSGGVLAVVVDAKGQQQRLRPKDARDPVMRAVARHLNQHPEIVARSRKADMLSFVFEDAGLGRISAAVAPFPLSNGGSWLIVSALPVSDFFGAVRQAGYMSLGFVALLVFSSLAVGFWTVGRILRPLYALTTAAYVIADGRWQDVPETHRTDEIGVLARALGNMTRSLRETHEELEQKVAERTIELSEANMKLKELDRLKSMFIASTSHELRTPLNAIIGFTGITLQGLSGTLNEEQQDNLTRVYQSAKHLLALIGDIIDISKIEAGKIDTSLEEFPLEDLVEEAVATVTPQLQVKGLPLEREISAGLTVYADRKRLFQCLVNLLSNAAKFTEKGSIVVGARESKGSIELSVTDSGIGIAERDLPRLFKPFERLESHLQVQAGGTGLGLYLTAKLTADILRGTISVVSRVGEGSTFTLSLPRDVRSVADPPDQEGEGGGNR
jgi:signal transduction histidine kinase